jgi:hypothetical protein
MECRFLLHNSKENMDIVAQALLESYSEIDVIMDDKDHKKTIPNKQLFNKITFVKNTVEFITSCDELSVSSEQRLIKLRCSIIDVSVELDR